MALVTIAPTILSHDPTEYKETIKRYYSFVKRVHIDLSDHTLCDVTTIPTSAVWWPKGWTADIHLISATPSKHLNDLLKIHPNLVIFHAEAQEDLLPIFQTLKSNDIKVGVAIVKKVFPGSIKTILEAADHALIFSGDLGSYGGKADFLLLEKVDLIRTIKSTIEIGWDGGATKENIHLIAHGGVNVINCGSVIKNSSNPAETYRLLDAETENKDIL